MTKEEILDNALPDVIEYPHYNLDNFQRSVALDAMDEYAKVQAAAFIEWAVINHSVEYEGFSVPTWVGEWPDKIECSPEQLYNLFLEHQLKINQQNS